MYGSTQYFRLYRLARCGVGGATRALRPLHKMIPRTSNRLLACPRRTTLAALKSHDLFSDGFGVCATQLLTSAQRQSCATFWDMDPPPRQETPERQAQAWRHVAQRHRERPAASHHQRPGLCGAAGLKSTGTRTCSSERGAWLDVSNGSDATTASRSTLQKGSHANVTQSRHATTPCTSSIA